MGSFFQQSSYTTGKKKKESKSDYYILLIYVMFFLKVRMSLISCFKRPQIDFYNYVWRHRIEKWHKVVLNQCIFNMLISRIQRLEGKL